MEELKKLAASVDNLFGLLMGEDFATPAEQILEKYPSLYLR